MTPQTPSPFPAGDFILKDQPGEAFWSYFDVALFIGLAFMSFLVALTAASLAQAAHFLAPATELVLIQCLLYVLVICSLFMIIKVRYDHPFWSSLGFQHSNALGIAWIAGGFLLSIVVGIIGVLLHTPEIQLPFQDLLHSRSAIISLGVLVVFLGPFCEELVFRGFLMPLFMRSMGALAGILLAGILFGILHGPEYRWSWQHVVLISGVGTIFGWARYHTRSTMSAVLMHATFNFTQFAAFVLLGNPAK